MVSIAINNTDKGYLKIKDSDGRVIYTNPNFQFIEHIHSDHLKPDFYLIHIKIHGRNYFEPLHIIDPDFEYKVMMYAREYLRNR